MNEQKTNYYIKKIGPVMEKLLETHIKVEDFCENIMSKQQCQELSTLLKQRTHLYREESVFFC